MFSFTADIICGRDSAFGVDLSRWLRRSLTCRAADGLIMCLADRLMYVLSPGLYVNCRASLCEAESCLGRRPRVGLAKVSARCFRMCRVSKQRADLGKPSWLFAPVFSSAGRVDLSGASHPSSHPIRLLWLGAPRRLVAFTRGIQFMRDVQQDAAKLRTPHGGV